MKRMKKLLAALLAAALALTVSAAAEQEARFSWAKPRKRWTASGR